MDWQRPTRITNFISRRFERGVYLGLHLTISLSIIIAALWLFGDVTEDVVRHEPLIQFDATLLAWFGAHVSPTGIRIFAAISWLGSPVVIATLGLLVAAFLTYRRKWLLLSGWLMALAGTGILDLALKYSVQRARPPDASTFLRGLSYSFPSGHALGSLVTYGMLAYLLAMFWAKRRTARIRLVAGAGVLILAIGFSRLYLQVHFFSDVVGGYAVGVMWLTACVTAVELARRQPRPLEPTEPPAS